MSPAIRPGRLTIRSAHRSSVICWARKRLVRRPPRRKSERGSGQDRERGGLLAKRLGLTVELVGWAGRWGSSATNTKPTQVGLGEDQHTYNTNKTALTGTRRHNCTIIMRP